MTVASGSRLGPYEVTGWLGTGGMGEVYRARDTRLGRDVAIKLIAERLAHDPARIERFEVEARAAGQLSHPNILVVYDVGVYAGRPYIVSELLDGEPLRARLNSGALTLRKAIDYGRQIAEGLAAAHDKHILHRDLKPDNLFVTGEGRIKILDFGLAKLVQPAIDRARQDTGDTEPGLLIGTVHYMSPEQVRGEPLDARSDIFSLGIILRELLTGQHPFKRATAADTVAAILKEDPASASAAGMPLALERIVSRCLEKAREARFQSARDLAFSLASLADTISRVDQQNRPTSAWRRTVAWSLGGMLAIGATASLLLSMPRPASAPREPLRLVVDLGGDAPLAPLNVGYGNALELSPDGATVAFIARPNAETSPHLYIRRLNQTRATVLAGTEDAISPFFSPDGKWIAFFANTKLKKVAATGGAPIVLADALSSRGGSWAPDDTIVFQSDNIPGRPLSRVPAAGGRTDLLMPLAGGEATQVWPQFLSGGRAVLYTSSSVAGAFNDANIVGRLLPDGAPRVIQRGGYHARYLSSGHLVYLHNGTLFAAPFDPDRLEITGPSVPALEGVMSNTLTGGTQFSVSDNGTLVYLPGQSIGGGIRLEWMDRMGKTTTLRATLANWFTPTFAPEGARVAMEVREGTAPADIWVYEPARDAMTRVTASPALDERPTWTPDGTGLAFASSRDSTASVPNLYWAPADGTGQASRLTTSANAQQPASWHPSGEFLAFEEMNPLTKMDIMILPLQRDPARHWKAGTPRPFVNGPKMEWDPRFSPDGRWLAYASAETPGDREVFVQPFPGPGARVQVSVGGGTSPMWSRTKRELLYGMDGQIMVVAYTTDGSAFRVGTPQAWSPGRFQTRGEIRMVDLHPDGERVALAPAAESPNGGKQDHAVFVFNFFDELQRLAPTSKR